MSTKVQSCLTFLLLLSACREETLVADEPNACRQRRVTVQNLTGRAMECMRTDDGLRVSLLRGAKLTFEPGQYQCEGYP